MPVTTLDPKTALVVIDLQKGVVAMATQAGQTAGEVVQRASLLAEAFRRNGLSVVLVNVAGVPPGRVDQPRNMAGLPPDWTELAPELNRQPEDLAVTKRSPGAFATTDLAESLRARGITQVVICGISTSVGVESTARQAYETGFNVTLATDAMADLNPDAHTNSLTRIFPRIGESGTTQQILELLARTHGEKNA